jgi:hypothetical protein
MSYASAYAMHPRRLLPLFALFAVLATFAAPALAQSVVIAEGGITRVAPFHTDPTARLWISRADCLANDVLFFPTTLNGYAGSNLDVWAGEGGDCSDLAQRSSTASTCWRVYTGVPTSQVAPIPIRVQDIISHRTPSADAGAGTPADCDTNSSGATSPVQVTLYFMLIQGTAMVGTGAKWSTKYDLVGPSAPTGVGIGVGETMLKVTWNSNADTDVLGYAFFCDPPPGVRPTNVSYFEAGNQTGSGGAAGAAGGGAGGATTTGGAGGAAGIAGAPAAGGSTADPDAAIDTDAATDADTDASEAGAEASADVSIRDAGTAVPTPDAGADV